jgi:signal transduction histidine kinase
MLEPGRARPNAGQWRALQAMAEISAAALVQARADVADEERLARARVDLARTIHEEVVQRLFGASLVLSSSASLASEELELCCSEVQGALRDLRSILGESLRAPVGAPARSLSATLRTLGDEPDVVVVCDGCPGEVAAEQDAAAQSILAEAVRNARKHARHPQITISARIRPELVTLTVENDGVPEDGAGEPGLGLRLAATEALHADGLLEHGRTAEGRWRVRLTLPNRPELP